MRLPDNPLAQQRNREIFIWVILLVLIFVPRLTNLGLFLGHDEQMRDRQSLDSFLAIVEGRWGDVYSSNFGGTNLTWARTLAEVIHFGWLRLQGFNVSLPDMVNYGPQLDPVPGAVFNALLIVILYWFMRKLFDWKIAALATAILALDPFLLSEARILRTEAAYAAFITLSTVSVALYVCTNQRRYLVWCGFWSAWSIATKVSGLILGPIIGIILFVTVLGMRPRFRRSSQPLKRLVIDLLIWGGVTIAFTFIIWPTLWEKPLQTFADLYNSVLNWGFTPRGRLVFFFLGNRMHNLPPLYYLLILLYKITPLIWLGLGAFVWAIWRRRHRNPAETDPTWAGFPFPLAGGLIILLSGMLSATFMALGEFKTERYMMAVVSNLDVTAAVGLVTLGEWASQQWQARQFMKPVFGLVTFAVFLAGHGLFAWLNHPYYFSYYSPLLGGGSGAVKTVQVGSGEGLDLALAYLNNKPDHQEQVIVCGTNLPRCEHLSAGQKLLKREALNAVHSDWIGTDYVVTYIFQMQRGDYPAGVLDYLENHPGPEYTATFQGIDYAKVYPAPHAQYVAASELTGISTLLGYTLDKETVAAGDSLKIKLYWENDGRIEQDMFVQLTDVDKYIWRETTASFSPGFEGLDDQPGAIIEGDAELSIPPGMPPGRYYLKMGYKTDAGQLIGQFELPPGGDVIEVILPKVFSAAPNPERRVNFNLDETLTLVGYDLDREHIAAGESIWLTLYWQAIADVNRDYVVGIQLLDQFETEVTYWLGRPARSTLPTNEWRQNQVVQDPWLLSIPSDLYFGPYELAVSVYNAPTGELVATTSLQDVWLLSNAD